MASPSRHPAGFGYIIGNEVAERFSYYGMKSILVVYMTTRLTAADGRPDLMSEADALFWYHLFGTANYLLPFFGALLADTVLGKYRTIVYLSVIYCLGHMVLAVDVTRFGLLIGLTLIAVGSGGIKPCVSAHLGDQYKPEQRTLIGKAYGWFYLSINVGAAVATLLIPVLLHHFGPHTAFAVPGGLMASATAIFIAGRTKFTVVPPVPLRDYVTGLKDPKQTRKIIDALVLFALLAGFWSLFDQTGSSWVVQAQRMNRIVTLPGIGSFEALPSQIQAMNPLLVLVLVPLFSQALYPWAATYLVLTPIRRICIGLLLSATSFATIGVAQLLLDAGNQVSIAWQAAAYILLTAGEVMVSVTALEFAYISAPRVSKSLVMSFYLLSVALGNLITSATSLSLRYLLPPEQPIPGSYFFGFGALAIATALTVYVIFNGRGLERREVDL